MPDTKPNDANDVTDESVKTVVDDDTTDDTRTKTKGVQDEDESEAQPS